MAGDEAFRLLCLEPLSCPLFCFYVNAVCSNEVAVRNVRGFKTRKFIKPSTSEERERKPERCLPFPPLGRSLPQTQGA